MAYADFFEMGQSAGGHPIEAYQLGAGPKKVVFVGGIHGVTEYGTVLFMKRAINHFLRHCKEKIPSEIAMLFVPLLNPDSYFLWKNMVRSGLNPPYGSEELLKLRFNSCMVDLNRNWDFRWKPKTGQVFFDHSINDGGTQPFSEPETKALRDFCKLSKVAFTVFYHYMPTNPRIIIPGREGRFISEHLGQVLISAMPHYRLLPRLGDYPGLAIDYLDEEGIPAVDIEIPSPIDYRVNLRGVDAVIKYASDQNTLP